MGYVAAEGDYYVKLEEGPTAIGDGSSSSSGGGGDDHVGAGVVREWPWCFWWWAKLILVVLFVGLLAAVFFKWLGPFVMDKEIIPIIIWEKKTFSKTMVALIVVGCLSLFPCLFVPSAPFMWVAGMTFGYGYGFLMILGGVCIGVSIPYLIGSLFYNRIHGWLKRHPKNVSIIRLAGEGDWINQFRAVILIRISPFPHVVYNYVAAATDVRYSPYLLGTLVGMVPEIFISIYTGILIMTLADASHGEPSLSPGQIAMNVAGFGITVIATVMVTIYAKRRLKTLQTQEEEESCLNDNAVIVALEGLKVTSRIRIPRIALESDNVQLISCLSGKGCPPRRLYSLVADIKSLLAKFDDFQLSAVKREANSEAHLSDVDMFGTRVGFLKFKADVIDKETGSK
ncbi:hypothetical protein M569_14827, partial [Genlisea aurea]